MWDLKSLAQRSEEAVSHFRHILAVHEVLAQRNPDALLQFGERYSTELVNDGVAFSGDMDTWKLSVGKIQDFHSEY